MAIDYRWAEGRSERLAEIAAEFVRLKVDVIVTSGSGALAAKQVTSAIPIVFAAATDPLGGGLVESLARPGGNATGLSTQASDAVGKRLELLRELLPDLRRLAIIGNVDYPAAVQEIAEVRATARTLGLDVDVLEIRRAEDIAGTFPGPKSGSQALYVCRSARKRQPRSHQHVGARRAAANDSYYPRLSRSGRFHVLWTRRRAPVPTRGRVCR